MGEAQAYYDPGADITCQHTAGANGGRFVSYPLTRNAGGPAGISDTGDGTLIVTTPAANAEVFGVTSHDVAAGGKVNIMRMPKVVSVVAGGTFIIGDYISTDNAGKAVKEAEKALEAALITVNKNTIPFDQNKPFVASGLRIGTPAVTTRGMKEPEMREIGRLIAEVIHAPESEEVRHKVILGVAELTAKFPLYPNRMKRPEQGSAGA